MKIVEGACHNAANSHPQWRFDPRLARSIAKRAAGTLRDVYPEELANELVQDGSSSGQVAHQGAAVAPSTDHGRSVVKGTKEIMDLRARILALYKLYSRMETEAILDGDAERTQALRDVKGMFRVHLHPGEST